MSSDVIAMVAEVYDDGFITSFTALKLVTEFTGMSIPDAAGALMDWAYVQEQQGRHLDGWKYR